MKYLWHEFFFSLSDEENEPGRRPFRAGRAALRTIAHPLSWLYHAGSALDRGLLYPKPLTLPGGTPLVVLSSPLVGGVGKTPLVALLATGLESRGLGAAIVTTGYGRKSRVDYSLIPQTPGAFPAEVGDEALMLWRMTHVPVHVGWDTAAVISRLDRDQTARCIIFDDGVRRRWVGERRIVVFAASDMERPVHFLPLGRWRVPPRCAWPASGVAILLDPPAGHHADIVPVGLSENHRSALRRWGFDGPVAWYRPRSGDPVRIAPAESSAEENPPDSHPFLFCGVGMPQRFERQVAAHGLIAAGSQRFPDHHPYSADDLARVARSAREAGSQWLLTTEKDAVKIDPKWIRGMPVFCLPITLELAGGDDMLVVILESLK